MFTTSKPLINFNLQFYLNVDRWQFCTETRAMISFSRIILLLDH